ncbi:MAG: hypothetical protein WD772_04065 [Pseudohongiellaceae bacterium]
MNTSTLLWSLLFGSIGFVYAAYGKKRKHMAALGAGIALIIFPYMVTNVVLMVIIGIALMSIPWFIRK